MSEEQTAEYDRLCSMVADPTLPMSTRVDLHQTLESIGDPDMCAGALLPSLGMMLEHFRGARA